MKRLRDILVYLRPYKAYVTLNIIFNLFTAIFSVVSIFSIVPFLDIIFTTDASRIPVEEPAFALSSEALLSWINYWLAQFIAHYGKVQALIIMCIGVVGLIVMKSLTRYLALVNLAVIRTGVVRDLRDRIYRKVLQLPLSYYSEQRKGNIISKFSSDVFEVEWTIMGSLEMLFREPLLFLIHLVVLVLVSWKLTLVLLVLLPVSAFLISRLGKSLKNAAKRGQTKLGQLLSVLEETLGGVRVIKAFNAEAVSLEKFSRLNTDYFRLMKKLYRRQYLASPLTEVLVVITTVLIIYYGSTLILSGNSAFDGKFFIAYLMLFSQLVPPAKSFSDAFVRLQRGQASVDRINELLEADLKITDPAQPQTLPAFQHRIEYRNVSFKYETDYVLKDINLVIEKGQTVALVGPSGGGKSTLADLLPRFYDVVEGEILIDDVPVTGLRLEALRHLMGTVSQESILFNDTIQGNIALSDREAPAEAVEQAAKIANAHRFISELEGGYATNIGDRGVKLSGGQRQRISIARAILKNPPILILDEATSALDTESEKLVQDALQQLMQGRTSLVIAHRLSTIQHADRIVVIQEGKIAEQGTHQELLAAGGVYKKLYDLQAFE